MKILLIPNFQKTAVSNKFSRKMRTETGILFVERVNIAKSTNNRSSPSENAFCWLDFNRFFKPWNGANQCCKYLRKAAYGNQTWRFESRVSNIYIVLFYITVIFSQAHRESNADNTGKPLKNIAQVNLVWSLLVDDKLTHRFMWHPFFRLSGF